MKNKYLIDTHCHLIKEQYGEKLENVIKETFENMKYAINISYSLQSSKEVIELHKKHKNLLPVIGIHPNDFSKYSKKDIVELENLIINNIENIKTIGEIGLDYNYEHNKEAQHKGFIAQLELARKYDLPVVLHIREAYDDVFQIIKNYKDLKLLCHSWNIDIETTNKYLTLKNLYFGYNGVITFKNAKEPKENILLMNMDRIVLETDCPWLTPSPFRGKQNLPEYVKHVANYISELLNMDREKLLKKTYYNALDFFNINNE